MIGSVIPGHNIVEPNKLPMISPAQNSLSNCSWNDRLRQEGYTRGISNIKQHMYLTLIVRRCVGILFIGFQRLDTFVEPN